MFCSIIYIRKTKRKELIVMMKNVFVKHFETGLLIYQKGMRNMLVIPNELKTNFYETMLTACMNG